MFRVEWIQSALDDLMDLWISADTALRQAITAASHQIDQQLRADPFQASEGREADERVLFVDPLGVTIEVDQTNRVVWVLDVWCYCN
jgi:hypothetical protein